MVTALPIKLAEVVMVIVSKEMMVMVVVMVLVALIVKRNYDVGVGSM